MLAPLIEKVLRREDLSQDEAAAAMNEVMAGSATPSAIAGLLTALVMKGERPSEIVGFATVSTRCRQERSIPVAPVATGQAPSIFHRRPHWWWPPAEYRSPNTVTDRCRADAGALMCSKRWA
jgi:hypothetical protein